MLKVAPANSGKTVHRVPPLADPRLTILLRPASTKNRPGALRTWAFKRNLRNAYDVSSRDLWTCIINSLAQYPFLSPLSYPQPMKW